MNLLKFSILLKMPTDKIKIIYDRISDKGHISLVELAVCNWWFLHLLQGLLLLLQLSLLLELLLLFTLLLIRILHLPEELFIGLDIH